MPGTRKTPLTLSITMNIVKGVLMSLWSQTPEVDPHQFGNTPKDFGNSPFLKLIVFFQISDSFLSKRSLRVSSGILVG